jgi:cytochrome c553
MNRICLFFSLSLFVAILFGDVGALPAQQSAETDAKAYFHSSVLPILVGQCLECHGQAKKGGLDLRTRAAALAGGESGPGFVDNDADSSTLFQYVSAEMMPPTHPLSGEQIAVLKKWIDDGAWFPEKPLHPYAISTSTRAGFDWWSLQPLKDVQPPPIAESWANADTDPPPGDFQHWQHNPIDRFIMARLVQNSLRPNQAATSRHMIRRLTYDLIGLPPTPAEVTEFLSACKAETGDENRVGDKAYEALVDRLLASPRFGETWGKHWLDVVRFGESTGFEVNHIIDNLWPYRDYVIRSLNEDKPYDQFVREHLAGDALDAGNPDIEIAMAFLVCGPYDIVGNQDAIQAARIRANTVDEMVRATSESFLGLTIGCSRCHDHKFDPISQKDYHRLYAALAGVTHADREIATQAQRDQRSTKLQPLQAQQQQADQEIAAINAAIAERAAKAAEELEKQWTLPATNRTKTVDDFGPVAAKFVRMTTLGRDDDPNSTIHYNIDEFEVWTAAENPRNVALLSNGAKATGASRTGGDFDEAYSAERTIDGRIGQRWIAEGNQLTIELANVESINRIIFSSDRSGSLQTHPQGSFPCEYRIEISTDGKNWTEAVNSFNRKPVSDAHRNKRLRDHVITDDDRKQIAELTIRRNQLQSEINAVPGFPVYRVGQLQQDNGPFHVFVGGDPQRKGDTVVPASLEVLGGFEGYELTTDSPEQQRRLQLANWIVDDENPITPRVLVNRLWHYHFGKGIVDTPSDFGFMGGQPTHPELLDYLANQLHRHQWKQKPIHKMIVMSQAYRQSSQHNDAGARVDQDSRLLWRYPQRRLSAEQLRDSILAVTGKLDLTMGGYGFRLYQYQRDNVSIYTPLDKHGPETYRRAVYHQHARATQIDLMSEYDMPDCSFSAPRRPTTTTPLQALTLMNHSFTTDMAAALAQRIKTELPDASVMDQIDFVYQLMLARLVTEQERALCAEMIESYGMEAFCRAMLNLNEFVYLD